MPTVEIVRFPGSPAFVENQLVFKDCLSTLVKSEGCISPYYGIQSEDNRTGYLFVIWESYDHHEKLKRHESYPGLITSLQLAMDGDLDVQHVDFDEDPSNALASGTTEVAVLTPLPGIETQEMLQQLEILKVHLLADDTCHSFALGESREKKGTWFLLVRWDSVEDHWTTIKKGDIPEIIKKLFSQAEIDLKHTKVTKYAG